MQQQSSQPPAPAGGPLADVRAGVNVFQFAARAVAFPVELGVRRLGTWGDRYLGLPAAAGLVWPFVFAALYGPRPGVGAVVEFWVLMLGLLAFHLAAAADRRRRGQVCHSRYAGESRFESLRWVRTPAQAHALEVVAAVLAAAAAAQWWSPAVGGLLAASAVAHAVNLAGAYQAVAARVRGMRDAEIEAGFLADQYRAWAGGTGR